MRQIKLLNNAQAIGVDKVFSEPYGKAAIQAVGSTTAGAGSATIVLEVSNDGENWLPRDTINLTLSTTPASAGIELDAPWLFVRANMTDISGTGAAITMIMRAG